MAKRVDHELVGVRGADEAWEVLETHVLAHPRRRALHRRVQEPVRQLLLCTLNKKNKLTKDFRTTFDFFLLKTLRCLRTRSLPARPAGCRRQTVHV